MKLRRGIAVILFIVIILPSMCMFQIFAGINSFAFDSNFYTTFIDSPLLYQSLADGIGVDPQLAFEMDDGPIRDTLLSVADPASLRQTAMSIANNAIEAVMNGESIIPVTTDISSWRDFIVNSPSNIQAEFIRAFITSAPDCGLNQPMMQEEYPLPVCIPSSTSHEQVIVAFLEDQEEIVANFPSSITYNIELDLGGAELGILQLRETFSGTMTSAGIIAFVMCIITSFIFANKVLGRFRWLGLTLMIPSILMIIASVLFSQTILSILGQGTMAVGVVDAEIANIVGSGLSRIGWDFFYAGLIPAIIGGLLFAYGSNATVRNVVHRGKQLGGKVKNNSSENVQKAKDGFASASSKTKDGISTMVQSENAQKAKDGIVSASFKAKDGISTMAQSESTQKAKDGIVSASFKAKDGISTMAQSENAQKAKDGIVSASFKAKDGISTMAQSESAQKAKERFGKLAKSFQQKDPIDDSIVDKQDENFDELSFDDDDKNPGENTT